MTECDDDDDDGGGGDDDDDDDCGYYDYKYDVVIIP